jgi:hypothetical protein
MASDSHFGGEEIDEHHRKNDLVLRILRSLWVAQVEALKGVLGAKQTVDLLTPFFLRMSNSGALQLIGQLGIKEKGIEDLAKVFSIMVPVNVTPMGEILVYEDGMSFRNSSECPYKNAPKEICWLQDQVTALGSLEAFGLEDEFEFTMDFERPSDARYCKSQHYVVKKGVERPKGRIIASYRTEDLRAKYGQDWIDDLSIQFKAEFIVQTTNMAIEELGKENAETLLIEAADEVGKEIAETWKKEDLANSFAVRDIIELLALLGNSMKQDSVITKSGRNEFNREVRSCPFSDSNPLVCGQLEAFTSRLCSELFPGSSYEMGKMMTKGDSNCLAKLTASDSQSSESPTYLYEDHLAALKLRLAKGEISETDYFRLKKLILEDR